MSTPPLQQRAWPGHADASRLVMLLLRLRNRIGVGGAEQLRELLIGM